MQQGSPEQLNGRLSQAEYIGCEADRRFYAMLAGKIEGFRRDGDVFETPDAAGPFAWRSAYAIYQKLIDREKRTKPVPANDYRFEADLQAWSQYVRERVEVIRLCESGEIDWRAREYLDVREGDLGTMLDPTSQQPGARRRDWFEVASRLSRVLNVWQSMTPDQKRTIPSRLQTKRLERKVAELEARISRLESTLQSAEKAA